MNEHDHISLTRYLDGALDAAESAAFERRLAESAELRQAHATLRAFRLRAPAERLDAVSAGVGRATARATPSWSDEPCVGEIVEIRGRALARLNGGAESIEAFEGLGLKVDDRVEPVDRALVRAKVGRRNYTFRRPATIEADGARLDAPSARDGWAMAPLWVRAAATIVAIIGILWAFNFDSNNPGGPPPALAESRMVSTRMEPVATVALTRAATPEWAAEESPESAVALFREQSPARLVGTLAAPVANPDPPTLRVAATVCPWEPSRLVALVAFDAPEFRDAAAGEALGRIEVEFNPDRVAQHRLIAERPVGSTEAILPVGGRAIALFEIVPHIAPRHTAGGAPAFAERHTDDFFRARATFVADTAEPLRATLRGEWTAFEDAAAEWRQAIALAGMALAAQESPHAPDASFVALAEAARVTSAELHAESAIAELLDQVDRHMAKLRDTAPNSPLLRDPPPSALVSMAPLPLQLPGALYVGTQEDVELAPHLTRPSVRPMLAHADTRLVSQAKPVRASVEPIVGDLSQVVDGDKECFEGSFIELNTGPQWIQIDLGEPHWIDAVAIWHYYMRQRVTRDVIVQISDDPLFKENVRTIFNNDRDNSLNQGAGSDPEYIETFAGVQVAADGHIAQYVRCYSNGNSINEYNPYIEIEVYGRPLD